MWYLGGLSMCYKLLSLNVIDLLAILKEHDVITSHLLLCFQDVIHYNLNTLIYFFQNN